MRLRSDAKLVNGPGPFSGDGVRLVGRTTINGWRMHAVYVPPGLNEGSAFAHHVVLVWTVGGHTYGVGFHDVTTLRQTLLLDERLARHIQLMRPRNWSHRS
jgi:hypothetical protein